MKPAFHKLCWPLVFISFFLASEYSINFNSPTIRSDAEGYYAYLPNLFIYGDPSSKELVKNHFSNIPNRATSRGIQHIKDRDTYLIRYPMGVAVLQMPFFLGAHFWVSQFTNQEKDGYQKHYHRGIRLAAAFYSTFGLILTFLLLQSFFGSFGLSVLCTFLIGFATNLFHYGTYDAGFSHVYSFFATTLFLLTVKRFYEQISLKRALWAGLAGGLVALIRIPSLIFVLILAALYGVHSWKSFLNRMAWIKNHIPQILTACLGGFLMLLPQFLYWHEVTGSFFLLNTYTHEQSFIYWNDPRFLEVWFKPTKGLFLWTPLMVFCMLGLLKSLLGKDSNPVAFPSLIIFLVASYMFASWWAPTLAGSYGNRGFIDFYGVFAMGLGVFLSPIVKNLTLTKILGIALVGLILTGSNFHRMSQYWRNILPFGSVSESLFWKTMNRW